ILLGGGIPLFGQLNDQIKLENSEAIAFANDFVQVKYEVNYL
ncbi:dihydrofolate reductase, partial [Salinivibrio sp. AR647]